MGRIGKVQNGGGGDGFDNLHQEKNIKNGAGGWFNS